MLRWPHDHHRNLRARLNAAASADRSDDQDRHLMTAPTPRSRKVFRSLSWSSTGRDSIRSNIQLSDQLAQQSSPFDPDRLSPILSRAVPPPVASLSLPSGTASVALKSP